MRPASTRRAASAAAAAVFDAAAQLFRQAQRMLAYCVQCGTRPTTTSLRPPAAAGDPPGGVVLHRRRRGAARRRASTAARRRTTPCRLRRLRAAFARLASAEVDADYGIAPRTLANAMIAHPEMVSGEHRSDLALMQAGRGDWVTKIGAEGVQAIGDPQPGARDRDQGRRRPEARPVPGDRGRARRSSGLLDDRRARRAGALGDADDSQLPRHRDRRSATGGCRSRLAAATIGVCPRVNG